MLRMRQMRNIHGDCVVEGVVIAEYSADLNSDDPENVQFSYWQNDPALYRLHKEEARVDQAAFEDAVYAIQDELIAEVNATVEEETE